MVQIKSYRVYWIVLSFLALSGVVRADADYKLSSLTVCEYEEYLFKNHFFLTNPAGKKVKGWYRYYPTVDQSMSVVDVNVAMVKAKVVPVKVRMIFFKQGEKQSHFDKTYSLKRDGKEFYFKDFDYSKDVPDPQVMPGSLHMVLIGQNSQPLCRIQQNYRQISYD